MLIVVLFLAILCVLMCDVICSDVICDDVGKLVPTDQRQLTYSGGPAETGPNRCS